MRRLLLVFLLALIPSLSFAQSNVVVNYKNTGATGATTVTPANPLPVTMSGTGGGLTKTSTAALAASLVVKATAGNLYSFEVSADSTLSAAAWWIMIFDATSLPGDGSVTPAKCYAFPSGVTSAAYAFPAAVSFTTGIVIGVSTTGCFTKTASTHAFISGDYQ